MKSLKEKHHHKLEKWLLRSQYIEVEYPEIAGRIVERIFDDQLNKADNYEDYLTKEQFSAFPI